MRTLEFKLGSTETNEETDFTVSLEARRGDAWSVQDSIPVTSGTPEAERKIMLNDDERIVISARGYSTEIVFDKTQNAAMPRRAFESQPTDEQKAEMEANRQAELRDTARGDGRLRAAQTRAADAAREDVLNRQQQIQEEQRLRREAEAKTPNPGSDQPNKTPSPATSTSQGQPQSPAAAKQTTVPPKPAGGGGMTQSGPSTGGQSSKDVKNG
jgi:hypothetical protein